MPRTVQFRPEDGGDCSLIRQFFLVDEDACQDLGPVSDASDLGSGSDGASSPTPDNSVTYSDKLKNKIGNEMTESEKFHEMANATETPPKTCFLLDDDGEFPPVAFAAS